MMRGAISRCCGIRIKQGMQPVDGRLGSWAAGWSKGQMAGCDSSVEAISRFHVTSCCFRDPKHDPKPESRIRAHYAGHAGPQDRASGYAARVWNMFEVSKLVMTRTALAVASPRDAISRCAHLTAMSAEAVTFWRAAMYQTRRVDLALHQAPAPRQSLRWVPCVECALQPLHGAEAQHHAHNITVQCAWPNIQATCVGTFYYAKNSVPTSVLHWPSPNSPSPAAHRRLSFLAVAATWAAWCAKRL
jgi:hypothetical protein